jgi:hypothetical protein
MPTQNLRPLATAAPNNWVLGAGATKVAAVDYGDPPSHDNDTTYISNSQVNNAQHFTLTNIPSVGQINTVSLGSRYRQTASAAGSSGDDRLQIGANTNTVNTWAFPDNTYQTSGPTAGSRPGGGSWVPSDLTSLEMGCRCSAGATWACRCTTLWIVLDYETPGGLIPFFLECITVGLSYPFLEDFARHVSFASQASVRPVTGPEWTVRPDEVVKFYRLLKERSNPRYCFLA